MSCKLCNHTELEIFNGGKVFSCKNCKCLFVENVKENKHPQIAAKNKMKINIQKKISKLLSQHYIEYLKKNTSFSFKTSLDIGTGYGDFVLLLKKSNVDAYGIESDSQTWKNRVTNSIEKKFFDQNFKSEKKFDLISINQSLYYFEDPIDILRKIVLMLKDDGILFIATINPESNFRKEHKIWTQGCNVCMSRKNFQELQELGLSCLDVSSFDDIVYKNFYLYKKGELRKYSFYSNLFSCILGIKKMTIPKDEGIHNYILLKKTSKK
ncbi:class I SAM-dependent methyltransferase [Nitrosopumilus sp.]|uniref:class I SAM-dependent methyltransferase n=1 Tax=Nitrosopumilus sp. TaxID=2024843 RepID=UPI003D0A6019